MSYLWLIYLDTGKCKRGRKMKTTICGNYPKIDHKKSEVNLRAALNNFENDKIGREDLEKVIRETIKRTVEDQVNSGINILADGQITWTDLVSPFCGALENVSPGGLRRFFDNNFYYRRPQVTGEMKRTESIVQNDLKIAASFSDLPLKAVICGPITFAAFADNFHYAGFEQVVEAIAGPLRDEIQEIEELGVEFIQMDEPALARLPEHFDLALKTYEAIFKGIKTPKGIALYFGPLTAIISRLSELPIDFMALDLVSHPDDIQRLPRLEKLQLHAGLIDARNIRLEDKNAVKRKLNHIRKLAHPAELLLTTSCGLEFLPRNFAMAKMKLMSEIAAQL